MTDYRSQVDIVKNNYRPLASYGSNEVENTWGDMWKLAERAVDPKQKPKSDPIEPERDPDPTDPTPIEPPAEPDPDFDPHPDQEPQPDEKGRRNVQV